MIVEAIANRTGLSVDFVHRLVRTASHRYKTYTIGKRNGGTRQIEHPAKELKLVQRWLSDRIFTFLPVHAAATAYRPGSTILANALLHVSNNYLLKIDFRDFFYSLKSADVRETLRRNSETLPLGLMADDDIEAIVRLVCRGGALTIGAPSSPALSNAIMYDFDVRWANECASRGIVYSRYADDLFFSTDEPGILSKLLADLQGDIVDRRSPQLTVNDSKTVNTSRKRRRVVAGLVLTSERRVSLGRERKRQIRSSVFKHSRQLLDEQAISRLRGVLAFARAIEPDFVRMLEQKYGPV
jgi:hypothetical protein